MSLDVSLPFARPVVVAVVLGGALVEADVAELLHRLGAAEGDDLARLDVAVNGAEGSAALADAVLGALLGAHLLETSRGDRGAHLLAAHRRVCEDTHAAAVEAADVTLAQVARLVGRNGAQDGADRGADGRELDALGLDRPQVVGGQTGDDGDEVQERNDDDHECLSQDCGTRPG